MSSNDNDTNAKKTNDEITSFANVNDLNLNANVNVYDTATTVLV